MAKDVNKVPIGTNVLEAAKQRIGWAFDTFSKLYLSGPSGKDSSVMMHLVCQEARRRGQKVGALFIDFEAQYQMTIDHVREMFMLYADVIEPHWVALPIRLRNAVSMEQPYWVCWDPECPEAWVRKKPIEACADSSKYPFYFGPKPLVKNEVREAMEFEEFIEEFGLWYGGGQPTACFVGIRCNESLNRWRAIVRKRRSRLENKAWTAWKGESLFNVYPIYDWRTEDIWTFYGRTGLAHNRVYDAMYKAGLSIHQARICQPYGDDQRKGLHLYHVLEPETWSRVVARVSGANSGALYATKRGNILGNGKVTLPDGHTWESFTKFLLASLPKFEREHYENKIAVFLRWWELKGVRPIPDEPDLELAKVWGQKGGPSWYRICKVILKNDRMCRGLSFSQHRSGTYARYAKLIKKRREQWKLI